jgi:aerobic-type carbon monoxide dehydrogenase small subunit (CoxS/CutS family)
MRGLPVAEIQIIVNGRERTVDAAPGDLLLDVLRHDLSLTGSKYGCGEGQCGACTVLMDGRAVKSCVTRVEAVQGRAITTIEGLATGDTLHPVQEAFLEVEAFQCGYCTPGMIMATVALLRTHPNPTRDDVARELDRNICRCGEYPRLVEAVLLAARKLATATAEGGGHV